MIAYACLPLILLLLLLLVVVVVVVVAAAAAVVVAVVVVYTGLCILFSFNDLFPVFLFG
jgi:hypothetical protein